MTVDGVPAIDGEARTGVVGEIRLYTRTAGVVAQLGERRNRTAEVEGSTPFDSTSIPFVQPGGMDTARP